MSQIMTAWMEELERQYGVDPGFARRLAPLLECLVDQPLGDSQRSALFKAIAATYQSTLPRESNPEPLDEVRLLVGQFIGELRKMEESVKVLGAMLQRVREQMTPAPVTRIVH